MTTPPEHTSAVVQPALVLLYGTPGASLVRRPLDRDAVILGKSRGCDLVLTAPDVSTVHCVITRTAGGFSVRDCGSRAGTRLNGEPVEVAGLHDDDLLQVGPFCFRVVLPPARKTDPSAEPRHLRLERKRRTLVRLALAQRRRLAELQKALAAGLPARAVLDLRAKASGLRQKVLEVRHRAQELAQAERDLARDRELLAREQSAFREQVLAAEAELARQRAEVEQEVTRRVLEQAESILLG
jgi:pSer/pThr/pTyr-binding forkhead associated (FHA) protein